MAVHGVNLHSTCRLFWHLQTAHRVGCNQAHLRFEMLSTYIGLCLSIAMLQCDIATQRSSNAHLRLPRSSGVAHTITYGSRISVQGVTPSAASGDGQVPGARLVAIQSAESQYLSARSLRRWKPANKACAGLWWCNIPMAGISWPKQVGQVSHTALNSLPSCNASVGLEATAAGGQ